MRKLLVLLLALAMTLGLGAYAFADDTTCELLEEDQKKVLEIKNIFLNEMVGDGNLTQEDVDAIYQDLENQVHHNAMRGLGFGIWLRDSEYAEELYDIMPHKEQGLHGGYGSQDSEGNYRDNRPSKGHGHRGGRHN